MSGARKEGGEGAGQPSDVRCLVPSPDQVEDDLLALTLEDYRRAIEAYVDRVAGHPGVRFVGRFGSLGTPGVSDIDLLVVATDEDYLQVRDRARAAVREIARGRYLFWHPVSVVPLSLVRVSRVLHSFEELEMLLGDARVLESLRSPDLPLPAVRDIVWGSYFWGVELALRLRRHGLRELLLVLGNTLQSVAAYHRIIGEPSEAQKAVAWGKETRQAILAAPTAVRCQLAVDALSQALTSKSAADWRMQDWWRRHARRGPGVPEMEVALDSRTTLQFRGSVPGTPDGAERPSPPASQGRGPRAGPVRLVLPSFYLELTVLLQEAFHPRIEGVRLEAADRRGVWEGLDPAWRLGIEAFGNAVRLVREFAHGIGDDERHLIGDLFVAPFNLRGKRAAIPWERVVRRVRGVARGVLPVEWLQRLRRLLQAPPVGVGRFGSLRRLAPVNRLFAAGRGVPIDRYYIQSFLHKHAQDIRGRVLEFGDDRYTRTFGGGRVARSDVLHRVGGNPAATIVADLADASRLPSDVFDCVICTQTLQYVYDVRAAVGSLHRMLKPGGVLLVTVPGISQISRYDMDRWGEYWRFSSLSMRRLLEEVFAASAVAVESHGNVLAAVAFLHGLAAQELRRSELDHHDPDYEVSITARAVKTAAGR